jgi:pimeloyl-ACP methyl ester carboxylesterase
MCRQMTTFVLVHGAWHGSWAWDRVAPRLRDSGARVLTPTLSGLGGNVAEANREIGLCTHVDDVVRVLDGLSEERVILVGHSYAGLVAREAADRRSERVAKIILVEGWAGPSGSSLLSLAPGWFSDGIRKAAAEGGDGWLIPAPHPAVFGITEAADVDWLQGKLRSQPLRTFNEATRLTGAVDEIPGVGIYCRPQNFPFAEIAAELGYELVGVDGPHDLMVSNPGFVAEQLLAAAEEGEVLLRAIGRRS